MANQSTIIKLLAEAASLIPEAIRMNRQFGYYFEYMQHYEFGLALDSLLELVDETGFLAPKEFWQYLYQAAETMRLEQLSLFLQEKAHS
ncbi:MAG TPA: hypothetical protein VHK69_06225 [Chitinophagaceae bacterium]|jgi:hypothetical protein|nr:hypothetical protein [Chitinophagaceae bacterium]